MFHPVGSQPPSVYWRRRLIMLGSVVLLIVLLVLTINAVSSNGDGNARAKSPSTPATSPVSSPASTPAGSTTSSSAPPSTNSPSNSTSTTGAGAAGAGSSSPASSSPGSSTPSTPVAANCVVKKLQLKAMSKQSAYKVGQSTVLELEVVNPGSAPCVQNLADKQVELRVYNGESRVWGSHDCQTEPGTTDRTLAPRTAVVVSIGWGGLTSSPGCKATRQQVGAGTYTLYASLSGVSAHASQFTIS